jgi:hypothetical protein
MFQCPRYLLDLVPFFRFPDGMRNQPNSGTTLNEKRPKRVSRNAILDVTYFAKGSTISKKITVANIMYVQFLRKEIMYQNIIQHVLNS